MRPTDLKTAAKRVAVAVATAILLVNGMPTTAIAEVVNDYAEQQQTFDAVRAANEPASSGEDNAVASSDNQDNQAATTDTGSATTTGDTAAGGEDASAADATTKDDVVDGSHMGDEDAARTEAPEISNQQYRALAGDEAAAADLAGDAKSSKSTGLPQIEGGVTLKSFNTEWVTTSSEAGSDKANLIYKPNSYNAFDLMFRTTIALSSDHDYEAGSIKLVVPTDLLHDRSGNQIGDILFSVPEAPDTSATFAYTNMGEYYVLTNTRKISASTGSIMFEYKLRNIDPTAVNGNPQAEKPSASILAGVFIDAGNGEQLEATNGENPLTVRFNTQSKINNANVSYTDASSSWPESWPQEFKPETTEENVVYLRFTSYADVSGNQPYTMDATHKVSCTLNDEDHELKILGMTAAGENIKNTGDAATMKATTQKDFKTSQDRGHYTTVYVAMKVDRTSEETHTYKLKDNVTYTLKGVDIQEPATKTATMEHDYSVMGGEVFPQVGSKAFKTGGNTYEDAFENLAAGKDASVTYGLRSAMFGNTLIKDGERAEGDTYARQNVTNTVTDGTLHMYGINSDLRAGEDYTFETLYLSRPNTYTYQTFTEDGFATELTDKGVTTSKISAGQSGFKLDNDKEAPATQVWGTVDDESKLIATVDWNGEGGPVVTWTDGFTGEATPGKTSVNITLPAGVSKLELKVDTNIDAFYYSARVGIKLNGSSTTLEEFAKKKLDDAKDNTAALANTATMVNTVTKDGAQLDKPKSVSANNTLGRTSKSSKQERRLGVSVKQSNSDTDAVKDQAYRLHHTSIMRLLAKNVADRDAYEEAIAEGKLKVETRATWTETLPKGLTVDLTSIKLASEDDAIENVQTSTDEKGNTILTVTAKVAMSAKDTEEVHTLEYDTVYDFVSAAVYGNEIKVTSTYTALDGDGKSVSKTTAVVKLTSPTFTMSGAESLVSADGSNLYSNAATAFEQGLYTYRLSARAQGSSDNMKNVVMYDMLDGAKDSQWQGTFAGVDTSLAEAAYSVDAKVYYTTQEGLDLGKAENRDLTKGGIWKELPADADATTLQSVKGIAIDASKAKDGKDVLLDKDGKPLSFYVKMRAPQTATGEAKNQMTVTYNQGTEGSSSAETPTTPTTVKIKQFKVKVGIDWDDDNNRDGTRPETVTVQLLSGGKPVAEYDQITLSKDNWTTDITGLPKVDESGNAINYKLALTDSAAIEGYDTSKTNALYTTDGMELSLQATHEPATKTVTGTKVWDDSSNQVGKRPTSVRIQLLAGDKVVQTKTVRANGAEGDEWNFSFDNVYVNQDGAPITYTVREDDTYHKGYKPGVVTGADPSFTITNAYDPNGALLICNTANDATEAAKNKEFTYTLGLTDADGNAVVGSYTYKVYNEDGNEAGNGTIAVGGSLKLKPGQYAKVEAVPSECEFRVVEDLPTGFTTTGKEKSGTIQAGRDSKAEFTNTYKATGSLQLNATKTINGGTNENLAPKQGQFTFGVFEGDKQIATASTNKDGSIIFPVISYTQKDVRGHTYTVKELGKAASGYKFADPVIVTVNVEDKGGEGKLEATVTGVDGQEGVDGSAGNPIKFDNTYTATGSLTLNAWTELQGGTLQDGMFKYGVVQCTLDENGEPKDVIGDISYVTSTAAGTIPFPEIKCSASDIGKTSNYAVVPMGFGEGFESLEDTVKLSGDEFTVEVTVIDNGDGTLGFETRWSETPLFVNKMKSGSLRIEKRLSEGTTASSDQDFTFHVELIPSKGQALPQGQPKVERGFLDNDPATDSDATTDSAVNDTAADDATATAESAAATDEVASDTATMTTDTAATDDAAKADEAAKTDATKKSKATKKAKASAKVKTTAASAEDTSSDAGIWGGTLPDLPTTTEEAGKGETDDGQIAWVLYGDGTLVVKAAGDKNTGNLTTSNMPWRLGTIKKSQITGIKIEKGVKYVGEMTDSTFMLKNHENLTGLKYIDFRGLDTSGVTSMYRAFAYGNLLESVDMRGCDFSNVKTMQEMFFHDNTNENRLTWINMAGDFSSLSNMAGMFHNSQNLTLFTLQNAKIATKVDKLDMNAMFSLCYRLEDVELKDVIIGSADVKDKQSLNLANMFSTCRNLKKLVSNGSIAYSSEANIRQMFYEGNTQCENLKSVDLTFLKDVRIKDADSLLQQCYELETTNLSGLDFSECAAMANMFNSCQKLNKLAMGDNSFDRLADGEANLSGLNAASATSVEGMFRGCSSLKKVNLEGANFFGASSVKFLFTDCAALENLDMSHAQFGSVTDKTNMMSSCSNLQSVDMDEIDLSKLGSLNSMFNRLTALKVVSMKNALLSSVTDAGWMFRGCSQLQSVDMENVSFTNVKNVSLMFQGCSRLGSLQLPKDWNTTNALNMEGMFDGCQTLDVLDLSNMDGVKPSSLNYAFHNMQGVSEIDLSKFNFNELTTMGDGSDKWGAFEGCSKLTTVKFPQGDAGHAPKLTSMAQLFRGCSSLESVSFDGLDAPCVNNFNQAFNECTKLKSINFSGIGNTAENVGVDGVYGGGTTAGTAVIPLERININSSTPKALISALPSTPSGIYGDKWESENDSSKQWTPDVLAEKIGGDKAPAGWWKRAADPSTYYTVEFSAGANEGEYSGSMAPQPVSVEADYTLPECGYVRAGYTFSGWKLQNGDEKKPGDVVSKLAEGNGKVTIEAQWTKNTEPEISSGSFDITVPAGQYAEIQELPAGTGYIVYEQTAQGWEQVAAGTSGTQGTIFAGDQEGKATAKFENKKYEGEQAQSATVNLAGRVTLDGAPANAGFRFELKDADGTVLETVQNAAGGSFGFKALTFNEVGTHTYTISQVEGTDDKIDYDKSIYTVEVTVTKNEDANAYEAKVTYKKGDESATAPTFANTSKNLPATEGTLTLSATVNGKMPTTGTYRYRVTALGQTLDVYLPGEYSSENDKYTFTLPECQAGLSVTIEELSSPDGYKLKGDARQSVAIVGDQNNEVSFDHTYSATGSAVVGAKVELAGGVMNAGDFSFSLTPSDASGNVTEGARPLETVGNASNGEVNFSDIKLSNDDPSPSYYVMQQVCNSQNGRITYDEHKVLVRVQTIDNGNGTLKAEVGYKSLTDGATDFAPTIPTFTNKVKEGKVTVGANVTGGTEASAEKKFTYKVSLLGSDGQPYEGTCAYTVAGGQDGTVANGDTIEMAQNQQAVISVPDGVTYSVELTLPKGFSANELSKNGTVAWNAPGEALFNVTYATSGSYTPLAKTVFSGGELQEGMFQVTLTGDTGIANASNGADGMVTFDKIDLEKEGAYEYTLAQVVDSARGDISYDTTQVKLKLNATDDGEGTLTVKAQWQKYGETDWYEVADGQPIYTFVNKRVTELPGTGRSGIMLATGAGLMLTLGCTALVIRRRRRE